ncbi:hypothetical protein V6N11_004524 [Hibiscus sabdariffa]|uniref:Uncharacterized protein n=1 Tax=Hibiscus sabdariffa TaxID=183260 RepID=A0ABR2SGJ4_9ROSI
MHRPTHLPASLYKSWFKVIEGGPKTPQIPLVVTEFPCLKDGLLFAALNAKVQGKDVGIPECEGAISAKSPWNAPELFDLSVLEGESIREWLFFDKSRRAFESGKESRGRAKINAKVSVGNPYSTQNAVAPTSGGFDSPGLVGPTVGTTMVAASIPRRLGFFHLRVGG